MSKNTDIGVVGLAVMGQNLVLNIADRNYSVSVYNRTGEKTEKFVQTKEGSRESIQPFYSIEDFVKSIKRPRKILLMVKAGRPTDAVIDEIVPCLESGDIVIDGGNALWTDTIRRETDLKKKDILFIGSGVSGGEEGARYGPSLMPGGDKKAWRELEPIWKGIAAKVDPSTGKPIDYKENRDPLAGEACTAYMGPDGAGHFVKMVHNGIEYADMQLICESFSLMKNLLGMSNDEISEIFGEWNGSFLDSFLIEISQKVVKERHPEVDDYAINMILDVAGQKGTGMWTARSSLDFAVVAPTIGEAVMARYMSSFKERRMEGAERFKGSLDRKTVGSDNRKEYVEHIGKALYASKICCYAQGFDLMRTASDHYNWDLDLSEIAKVWRNGCIIRASFLQKITEAYLKNKNLSNLVFDDYFSVQIIKNLKSWREIVSSGIREGIYIPCFASSINYFDGCTTEQLPFNLLQGLRDYFGAHGYERNDRPRGEQYHLTWEGTPPTEERVK